MPFPSPFHARTLPLCTSMAWKTWAGYYAVRHFDASPEREYNAVRQGAGLLDVSPLYKLDVRGRDAGALLDYVLSRPVAKLKTGRITYLCWCDDHGKVLDDGTCWRLGKERWRITAASPAWAWFDRHARGLDVEVVDVTERLAALALQGPTARAILIAAGADVGDLRFFGWRHVTLAHPASGLGSIEATVSRTGYTGDLGYELWVDPAHALALWDILMAAGKPLGIWPIGLDTLDITRIEAGFILQGNDYYSAVDALTPANTSSPFEIGLGWTVELERDPPFIGQRALIAEKARGSPWAFVGLVVDWPALEAAYARHDLPPSLPTAAWRARVPLYRGVRQIGYASSGTWSPILKQNLALASVFSEVAAPGSELDIEILVDWERARVPAVVTPLPFFDPPRKRS
ncbi:MAG: aminomethyl transferase family protein [Deltaproteobacteria bacterium]|nr:aminomethyl transferase family protein [Deltaproteobacteria bacterium]